MNALDFFCDTFKWFVRLLVPKFDEYYVSNSIQSFLSCHISKTQCIWLSHDINLFFFNIKLMNSSSRWNGIWPIFNCGSIKEAKHPPWIQSSQPYIYIERQKHGFVDNNTAHGRHCILYVCIDVLCIAIKGGHAINCHHDP